MQTITLSNSALTLLRYRLAGDRVEVTDETRPLYQELVEAGMMMPLHTFALGPNSAYRLTEAACDLRDAGWDGFTALPASFHPAKQLSGSLAEPYHTLTSATNAKTPPHRISRQDGIALILPIFQRLQPQLSPCIRLKALNDIITPMAVEQVVVRLRFPRRNPKRWVSSFPLRRE